jgi:hypothetical protein
MVVDDDDGKDGDYGDDDDSDLGNDGVDDDIQPVDDAHRVLSFLPGLDSISSKPLSFRCRPPTSSLLHLCTVSLTYSDA